MVRKHDCPYLENGMFCSHKGIDPKNSKHKSRRRCPYKRLLVCPLLKDSKTLLISPLKALEDASSSEVSHD